MTSELIEIAKLVFDPPQEDITYETNKVRLENEGDEWKYLLHGDIVFSFNKKKNLLTLNTPQCAIPATMGRHHLRYANDNKNIVAGVWKEVTNLYFRESEREILHFLSIDSGESIRFIVPRDYVRYFYHNMRNSRLYSLMGDLHTMLQGEATYHSPISLLEYAPVATLEERVTPHILMYWSTKYMKESMWLKVMSEVCVMAYFGKEFDGDEVVERVNLLIADLRFSGKI